MFWFYILIFLNTYVLDFAHDSIDVPFNSEPPENGRLNRDM